MTRASADAGRQILEFRTTSMGDAVMSVLKSRREAPRRVVETTEPGGGGALRRTTALQFHR